MSPELKAMVLSVLASAIILAAGYALRKTRKARHERRYR